MAVGPTLTLEQATSFADVALANVAREFPNKLDHVMGGEGDVRSPRALHPAFYGSFDWHSSVHMHWLLARLLRLFPHLPQRAAIGAVFDRHLAADAIAGECAYLAHPESRSFERTYGWAWLLALAQELTRGGDPPVQRRATALAPLAACLVERYLAYLPMQRYPLRNGVHTNSAFGLLFALDYAIAVGDARLKALCVERAHTWFAEDRAVPAAWEPSGADFLSPSLIEAQLMHRVLPAGDFGVWLGEFLPELERGEPTALFLPVEVSDRSDPYLVHLDGLNFSRAWCCRGIAAALPSADARIPVLEDAWRRHVAAGNAGLAGGSYMGEHWLATFAALALTD
ncbi:MAG TPA: DUF2891 domain-containing protein [Casimicrobiaceae bacterium]